MLLHFTAQSVASVRIVDLYLLLPPDIRFIYFANL